MSDLVRGVPAQRRDEAVSDNTTPHPASDKETTAAPGAVARRAATGGLGLTFFGGLWAAAGIEGGGVALPTVLLTVDGLVVAGLLALCAVIARRSRSLPSGRRGWQPSVRRGFLAVFATEMGLIAIASLLLPQVGLAYVTTPAIALIVGVHFFPLARLFRVRLYHVTATALTILGIGGLGGGGHQRWERRGPSALRCTWVRLP